MVFKSDNLFLSFFSYIIDKLISIRICRTCEHKILPYQDTETVAYFKEIIRRIDSAAPDTKHIHVSIADTFFK